MILSLSPHYKGDENVSLAETRIFSTEHALMMERASAVVAPQSISHSQYSFCTKHARRVFPNYTNRFKHEGKIGNFQLLKKFHLPHPRTRIYESAQDWRKRHPDTSVLPFPLPFVMKADQGGGGFGIFLVRNIEDILSCLNFYENPRKNPNGKFVAQEFIQHGNKDLRVVLIGNATRAYWRCQNNPDEFRNNVGRGAFIRHDGDPDMTLSGMDCVHDLKKLTGIDVAAVDVLFDIVNKTPKIGEINFLFGRKGIGGTKIFRKIFSKAAKDWIGQRRYNGPNNST